jgi:hypothetical protein
MKGVVIPAFCSLVGILALISLGLPAASGMM